jgi:hypothetical protein
MTMALRERPRARGQSPLLEHEERAGRDQRETNQVVSRTGGDHV